jgi:photosystem II stability/assembly factor-like uncharacterized protein
MFRIPHFNSGGSRRTLLVGVLAAFFSLFLLSGAQSGVNSPGSGWYAGNPLLGPSNLTYLATAGGTTFAAGDLGTLLKSTDGGATWLGIVTGIQDNLTLVRIVGGDPTSLVIGGHSFLLRSDDGGQTFTRLPFSHGGGLMLTTVAFPSKLVGYLVLSNGSVLSTADGGQTFTRKTAIPGGTPNDLIATSDTTAFAVTGNGTIQRTTDGASSWTQVASVGVPLRGIDRADATTMYAVGNRLTVLKSVDGGATWAQKPVSGVPSADLTSIRTAGPGLALITTAGGAQLIRTTDGGETFSSVVPSSDSTLAVAFVSTTRAIGVGANGSAETSADSGANWKIVGSRIVGSFRLIYAVSGSVAYAGGDQGVLARTVDRGQTWVNISPPTAATITGIAAPTPETLFVLAADGSLQRSDNGGASYRILDTGTAKAARAVVALDRDHVLLIGPRGISHSTNGGDEFALVENRVGRTTTVGAAEVAGKAVYAYAPGRRELILSRNGGATWTRLKTPDKRSIRDLAFGTATRGFLLDTRGELWQTTNAGNSWKEIECLGAWRPSGVDFADATHGFVLVSPTGPNRGAYLLRTNDAGKTWHPQFVSGGPASALEGAGGTSYLLVGNSVLYSTTTGGDVGVARKLKLVAKPRTLARAGIVTLRGRLSPRLGGEDVIVSRYMRGAWAVKHVTVASNGSFGVRWSVTKTAVFVAQVFADADRSAAATPALRVRIVPNKR